MDNLWHPWQTKSPLPAEARLVELRKQQAAIHDLLGTSLPQHVRVSLKEFEQKIAAELANDNIRVKHGKQG